MSKKNKIAVVGSGYVGMSLAVLLAQHNDVCVLDIDHQRVKKINRFQSTVADSEIERYLLEKKLSLSATVDKDAAYEGVNFVVVATPTNYDVDTNRFDTSTVDAVVNDAIYSSDDALVVIKSTVPVGTRKLYKSCTQRTGLYFRPNFFVKVKH